MASLTPLDEIYHWPPQIHEIQENQLIGFGRPNLAEDEGIPNLHAQQLSGRTNVLRAGFEAPQAEIGLSVPPTNGYAMTPDGALYRNATGSAIVLTGSTGGALAADGLTDTGLRSATLRRLNEIAGLQSDGLPYWAKINDSASAAQSIPSGVWTRINNMTEVAGNLPAGLWNGSTLTIGAASAGIWLFCVHLNTLNEIAESQAIYKNGANVYSIQMNAAAGDSIVTAMSSIQELAPGDTIEFFSRHASGAPRDTNNCMVDFVRLAALAT